MIAYLHDSSISPLIVSFQTLAALIRCVFGGCQSSGSGLCKDYRMLRLIRCAAVQSWQFMTLLLMHHPFKGCTYNVNKNVKPSKSLLSKLSLFLNTV